MKLRFKQDWVAAMSILEKARHSKTPFQNDVGVDGSRSEVREFSIFAKRLGSR